MFKKIFLKAKVTVFCLIVILLVCGYNHAGQSSGDTKTAIWSGQLKGMAEGKLILNTCAVAASKNEFSVESRVTMKLKQINSGSGQVSLKGILKGRLKDGLLKAKISGHAYDDDGAYSAKGDFVGTLSETQGFGMYNIYCEGTYYKGGWTLNKK